MNIGNLTLHSLAHAFSMGKEISVMNMGEAFERMHDPIRYLVDLFSHEHLKLQYVHENELDDSMFQGANNYKHEMHKITGPERKLILYKYQKEVKTKKFGERGDKLKIKEDLQKEKTEQEVGEDATSYVVALVAQPKAKGKFVLQGSSSFCIGTMDDTLQKGPK